MYGEYSLKYLLALHKFTDFNSGQNQCGNPTKKAAQRSSILNKPQHKTEILGSTKIFR